jgi:AcrR family transcriptional regulator
MTEAGILSPLKAVRRDKIMDAAQMLFTEQGLRATTMESIAARSGISKATVYAYFCDKDEVFSAVAARIAEQVKSSVRHALDQPGTVSVRIATALNAKHGLIFDIVRRSAFASELFAAQNQIAAERFSQLDIWIQGQMADAIKTGGREDGEATALAFLLFSAAAGIANHAQTADQSTNAIDLLSRSILGAQ